MHQSNTNISRLSFPVKRVQAACLHRLCYIINAVCLLIQTCSLCQSWLCVLYSCFILLFKLAYLIHFLSFFCLSLLSFTLFFMPMSGSFFYFLLNNSLIISHVPLLPISFFHILSFHEDCMQSDCLLASHSSLFVDLPSHIKTVGKVLPIIEEAPPIISSLPGMTGAGSQ